VNVTRVGYRHNDVFTAYVDLGSPAGRPDAPHLLPDAVLNQLRASCTGRPETRKLKVSPGDPLSLDLPLNQNDVYFISIER
jgi:xylan 1,4-beta-xylosidase